MILPNIGQMPAIHQMRVISHMNASDDITSSEQDMCVVPTFDIEKELLLQDKKINVKDKRPAKEHKKCIWNTYKTEQEFMADPDFKRDAGDYYYPPIYNDSLHLKVRC